MIGGGYFGHQVALPDTWKSTNSQAWAASPATDTRKSNWLVAHGWVQFESAYLVYSELITMHIS